MAQMLATVVNERQDGWDVHLPHAELACKNSVSTTTRLAYVKLVMIMITIMIIATIFVTAKNIISSIVVFATRQCEA